jgi:hypothetical protein
MLYIIQQNFVESGISFWSRYSTGKQQTMYRYAIQTRRTNFTILGATLHIFQTQSATCFTDRKLA